MNYSLISEIVKHVMASFSIIQSDFINHNKTKSIKSKDFLLEEQLSFQIEDNIINNKVWGCQISSDQQEIKVLLGDCSQDLMIKEYCLLVQLKNAPAYGLYLIDDNKINNEAMLAVTINGVDWMECQTYLQATFLAAMEQIKDMGLSWNKCSDYKEQYKLLVSFINFHNSVYEERHEG